MHALSKDARFVIERMEADRRYDVMDLRALLHDASAERVREVMHELWINRHVERVDHGWRRHRSAPAHSVAKESVVRQTKVVKPEDLFDHDTFQDFFR